MNRLSRPFHKWIFFHFFEFTHYYIGAIASLYFLHYFQSEIPGLTKELADLMEANNLDSFNLYYFIVLAFAILFFRTMSRLLFFYPARIQQKNLRIEFLGKLESAYPRSYAKFSDGAVFSHLFDDLNRLRGFIGFALLQVGNIVIASIVFIPKLTSFNSDFLIAFVPVIVCMVIFMCSMYFLYPINKKIMEKHSDLQNFIIESYEAKHTIKNYSKEFSILQNFRHVCSKELAYFFKYDFGITIPFNLIKVGVAGSLIWAASIVYDGQLKSSDLIFFSGFLFLILEPLMSLSWIGIVFSQGFGSWTRIKEMLNGLETQEPKASQRTIEYKSKFWNHELNLNIQQGQWNILVGDTGVGKSFVMEEIAISLAKNGQSYSFIQQEPFMYNDSLRSNIFLGLDQTDESIERAKKYIKEFGLDVLAPSLDEVLDIEIGENGKKVSGGQAKRIALIRSLISDADILIWDDPFSSVDLILEDQISKFIKKDEALREKTFILSSHRFSTVRNSKAVIFLDKEEGILEQGEVLDLINKESKVNEYFKKQLV